MMSLWQGFEAEEKRGPRRRGVMNSKALKALGLFCPCDYQVDLHAFAVRHPVELPDGRRFVTEDCALAGLDAPKAAGARVFWRLENNGHV